MADKKNKIKYNKFICEFYNELNEKNKAFSDLIFLCIGTDRLTGDCFGPLVGDKLKGNINNITMNARVYGSLEEPIIQSNVNSKINEIYIKYDNPCIVAIDAALSTEENIGKIIVTNNSLKLGKGLQKNIAQIGNISIKGVIGKKRKSRKKNMEILQNTSLNIVMNMASIVSNGIMEVLQEEYNFIWDLLYKCP